MKASQAVMFLWAGTVMCVALTVAGYATNRPVFTWFLIPGVFALVSAIALQIVQARKR